MNLRRDIVRTLSYQIGEGRDLSIFEVKSVIDSHTRHADGRCGQIEVEQIVEDLVAETIASPLLDRDKKCVILKNLRNLHQRGRVLTVIDRYRVSMHDLLSSLRSVVKLTDEDVNILVRSDKETWTEVPEKVREPLIDPEMFARIGVVVTGIAFLVFFFIRLGVIRTHHSEFLEANELLISISVGMLSSALAITMSFFVSKLELRLSGRKQTQSQLKEKSVGQEKAGDDSGTRANGADSGAPQP